MSYFVLYYSCGILHVFFVVITLSGYLSDGDLLSSGNNGNGRPNDGYLSESGASIYARRLQHHHHPQQHQQQPSPGSESRRSKMQHHSSQGTSQKHHAFITEDR